MKNKLQLIIIVLAIFTLWLSVKLILDTPTMIISSWFLILLFVLILFFIAFILGSLLKGILKSEWHKLTFGSMFIIIICSVFYISQYKSSYKIVIPKNYSGEVKLFVSNEKENDFVINNHGIGYINKETFDNGFYPKIFKGDSNITKQVKKYGKGALATTIKDRHTYDYLSFVLPSNFGQQIESNNIKELIRIKAIDTTRLYTREAPAH